MSIIIHNRNFFCAVTLFTHKCYFGPRDPFFPGQAVNDIVGDFVDQIPFFSDFICLLEFNNCSAGGVINEMGLNGNPIVIEIEIEAAAYLC